MNAQKAKLAAHARSLRKITDEQVREILTSTLSHTAMGRRLGVNRDCVSRIRYGTYYTDVLPEIERWAPKAAPSCWKCIHGYALDGARGREPGCRLEFPDPGIEGHRFARFCAVYQPETKPEAA